MPYLLGKALLTQNSLLMQLLKYGRFDVRDALPHPTTVTRHVKGKSTDTAVICDNGDKAIIETYECAITTDICTDDYHKTLFISSTIHCTNNDFVLMLRVLFVATFENGVSKMALLEQTHHYLLAVLCLSLTVKPKQQLPCNGYTTRLNCNGHILNVVLSSTFAPKVLTKSPVCAPLVQKN